LATVRETRNAAYGNCRPRATGARSGSQSRPARPFGAERERRGSQGLLPSPSGFSERRRHPARSVGGFGQRREEWVIRARSVSPSGEAGATRGQTSLLRTGQPAIKREGRQPGLPRGPSGPKESRGDCGTCRAPSGNRCDRESQAGPQRPSGRRGKARHQRRSPKAFGPAVGSVISSPIRRGLRASEERKGAGISTPA
jgi:hypothetical protein